MVYHDDCVRMSARPTTNKVELEGYVMHPPKYKQMKEDVYFYEIFIETHDVEKVGDRLKFRQEKHRATAWGARAIEANALQVRKEDRVRVLGKLQTRTRKNKWWVEIFTGVIVESIEVTERRGR